MRFSSILAAKYLLVFSSLLSACDSTPRERQAAVRKEVKELDTLARTGTRKLARLGKGAAQYRAAARARRAEPLDPQQQRRMEAALLGSADRIPNLTPATIAEAYAQLVRETRTRRPAWTERDWDYARVVYQRLNAQLKAIRLDLPARDELRIRTRQAEFVTLQAGHTAKEINANARQLPK